MPRNITITPLAAWIIDIMQDGSMFNVVYAKFWSYLLKVTAEIKTHQTRHIFFPQFLCIILVMLCELLPQFAFLCAGVLFFCSDVLLQNSDLWQQQDLFHTKLLLSGCFLIILYKSKRCLCVSSFWNNQTPTTIRDLKSL